MKRRKVNGADNEIGNEKSASLLKIWVGRWAYESPIWLGILQVVSAKSRWTRSHHPDPLGDGRRWVDFHC